MKKKKVMIVDDQFISRELFEMYIKASEEYEVIYSIESAAFADVFVMRNKIDLVLMDILMNDGSNGLDAAVKIKKNSPGTKIIAVTSMPEHSWIEEAKKIGIESFWYKETSKEKILDVMNRTMEGESVYPEQTPEVRLGNALSTEFTRRELEVLRYMTTGVSNSSIAQKLGISENTVKNHIRHMMEKTGCKNRTELAIKARVSGIVISME
ncbi:MAG: response regulator transcription factor [Eubacterium sp.]|nr:response regulator transcription factor [Eubacterium sp.]MDD7208995.1 response regulator transcription factor [Lachnospiraceae bacterium]MDY5497421.1 response regulator transcription factor [Anaerobutyricum sp.]